MNFRILHDMLSFFMCAALSCWNPQTSDVKTVYKLDMKRPHWLLFGALTHIAKWHFVMYISQIWHFFENQLAVKMLAYQCSIFWHFLLSLELIFKRVITCWSEKRLSLRWFLNTMCRELLLWICREFRDLKKLCSILHFLTVIFTWAVMMNTSFDGRC